MTNETMLDYRFPATAQLTLGGAAARWQHNLAALALLKQLESHDRAVPLTTAEQEILTRYSGWGDAEILQRAFPTGTSAHATPHPSLAPFITPEETSSLLASSLNAHYTSLPLIRAIYTALDHFGLMQEPQTRLLELEAQQSVKLGASAQKLRVLEPAAGIGHWLGAMPPAWHPRTERVAVEIDLLSGHILQRLYPQTKVFIQPFEAAPLPENYFDLILSNVPFGNYAVADSRIREQYLKASIHDYFLVKALRLLRPGGIIAFITSRYTLDKQSPKVREHLAAHAKLLAAARLPGSAFRAAGTEVITDVIVLQKRLHVCRTVNEDWIETSNVALRNQAGQETTVKLNAYYEQHPAYLLGTPTMGRSRYHADEFQLQDDGRDLATSLADCLCAQLPLQGYQVIPMAERAPDLRYAVSGDDWQQAEAAALSERTRNCATALRTIYLTAKAVIALQLQDADDETLQAKQQELSELYTRFKAQYGYLHKNLTCLAPHSPALPFLQALEIPVGKNLYHPAPLFTQRTVRPVKPASNQYTPKEALLHCLNELGRVDLPYLTRLCQSPPTEILTALAGLLYETPDGSYVTAEEYLSGDVRQKLREAERAAACNPVFTQNVQALQAVQPAELGQEEIIVRLGASWVPEIMVKEFVTTLVPSFQGTVRYLPTLATWKIEEVSSWARCAIEANQTWGTSRVNAFALLEDILNLRTTIITDESTGTDGKARRVVNDNETIAAQAKQLEIKQKFATWIWQDEARAAQLIQIYNERFNSFRKREFDGSHLVLPGMTTSIDLYAHQKNSIWRILQSKATLLAHCVGAGKTFVLIAAALELKRLGLCHKTLIVVPNHLPAQWAAEAQRLYPNIRLLAPGKEHLTSAQRGELLSRIATSDYDVIIIPQTAFKMLPLAAQTVREHMQRELNTLQGYLEDAETNRRENKRSIKEIQRALKRLQARMETTAQQIQRLNGETITWEELGIDALFLDEFHHYKNLYCPTKMTRVAGLPNTDSQRAFDCFMKVRAVLESGGRVVCATATPVSNTIAEVYTCQKYLQLETLQELGLDHFDAWVQQFAETTQALEMTPDGSGFRMNTRFNKFTNIPELSALWQKVLEVKSAAELQLPRPKLQGGKPEIISVPASENLRAYVQALARRVDAIKARRVPPHVDNMLKVTSDGRKAALDIRLVDPAAERPPQSKVSAVVENLTQLYHATKDTRGVQLVFLDIATPKGRSEPTEKGNMNG